MSASKIYRSPSSLTMALLLLSTSADAAETSTLVLDPITIKSKTNQGSTRPGALREDIVKTESISERRIERSGATNLTEALEKQPGIAVQVECSICNVRNVLLNNLPGRYTTLMIDGIPIYSSVSSAYGLDSVSVWGIERIDVARGAGASLIAPEALAGSVNIVSKRPTQDMARLRMQAGSYGARLYEGYLATVLENSALTATFSKNQHDSVDESGEGVSEYTGYDRKMLGLGWFADDLGGFKVRGRLDIVDEQRSGGALGTHYNAIKADQSGNPFDFSRGRHGSPFSNGWLAPDTGAFQPYDQGRAGLSEIIFTDRYQLVTSAEKLLGEGKLRLAFGAAEHKQDSFYEITTYKAKQQQYYVEASYQFPVADWLMTAGLNYRFEDLRSHGFSAANNTNVKGVDNYRYRTPALFLQAYRTYLDEKLEVNGSVRLDHHNVFGNIASPRFNALYHHTDEVSSRFSIGRGFRAPTSFFEQDHGILDDIRIIRMLGKPEKSDNLSYALSYADERLAVTSSYNYNRIHHMAILTPGVADPAGGSGTVTLFENSPHQVVVQGVDINMSYQLTPSTVVSVGGERFHYEFAPGTLIFSRPEARAFFTVDYERGPWTAYFRLNWTGPHDLAKFYDYENNPRYNFDGSRKRDKSPSYSTTDIRAEYQVNKRLALYAGADNLFDFKQTDHENFLWIDGAGGIDFTHLWGPGRGRYLYTGFKISL
ncbi:TonB-dependent receptor [Methylobacillus caricis]|uniref:TonB-dependent receptor plug domain-containing protein n=1 Tax=Methylobacillus caricis TaxID=1971611 RepID=UPI001CFFA446|nr:TonB-dependent receptor [Methylobacillus caricis]MCB5187923.1 TonB-dependent receptor [Methylobacillus caricis]